MKSWWSGFAQRYAPSAKPPIAQSLSRCEPKTHRLDGGGGRSSPYINKNRSTTNDRAADRSTSCTPPQDDDRRSRGRSSCTHLPFPTIDGERSSSSPLTTVHDRVARLTTDELYHPWTTIHARARAADRVASPLLAACQQTIELYPPPSLPDHDHSKNPRG